MKRLIASLLSLGITSQGWAAGYTGQSCHNGSGAVPPIACSAAMNVTNGNQIVCMGGNGSNVQPTISHTGTASVTWGVSIAGLAFDSTNSQEIVMATGTITGSGTATPSMNFAGSPGAVCIFCAEFGTSQNVYDGLKANVAGVPGTGANALKSGQITTTADGDYLIGGSQDTSGTSNISSGTVTVTFAQIGCDVGDGAPCCLEWGTQTTHAAATEADWTVDSATHRYVANIVAMKASGGGAAAAGVNKMNKLQRLEE